MECVDRTLLMAQRLNEVGGYDALIEKYLDNKNCCELALDCSLLASYIEELECATS